MRLKNPAKLMIIFHVFAMLEITYFIIYFLGLMTNKRFQLNFLFTFLIVTFISIDYLQLRKYWLIFVFNQNNVD